MKKKKMKPWLKAILIFVAVNIVIALPLMGFIEVLVLKGKGHKPSDMDYRGYIEREYGVDWKESTMLIWMLMKQSIK